MKIWNDIDWSQFHFLRAEYLWLAFPMAIIILIGVIMYGTRDHWKKHIAKHLQPYVIQKGTSWKGRIMHISLFFLFALAFIGFLGPTWAEEKAPAKHVASKLVIALDLSQSMLTTDVSPNRLERAKFKIQDLLKANPRAETALIVFAASCHTVIPFTTDYKIITDNLDGLQPHMMPKQGTGFKMMFTKLDSLFTDNIAPGRVLLLTDDLEGLNMSLVSSFIQNNNASLSILPFATTSGGNVPGFNNNKAPLKVKGKIIYSKINTNTLEALKQIDSVTIMDLTLDKSDVSYYAQNISKHLIFEERPKNEDTHWQDQGYWLLIPLMLVFAFSFRKGWGLLSILCLLSLSGCADKSDKSVENTNKTFHFKDLWYTKPYQAQQAYNEKHYTEAAETFNDPMRKGVAYYKAGNFTEAKQAFEKDSSASGQYNLGLTYAKLGDLNRAKQIFETLVKTNPEMTQANRNLQQVNTALAQLDEITAEESTVSEDKPNAKNKQNDSPEDFSGGGQKATKKQMEKKRLEETVDTGKRKGKESEELPDDFKSGKGSIPKNILMRKVDDDPSLFLTRKFKYQIKKQYVETEETQTTW